MNPQDYRLGNWFQDRFTKDKFQVLELSNDKVIFDYETKLVWQAEPIELTEEVLSKCRFDLNSIPYHAIKGQVVLFLFRGVWSLKHVYIEIKYLHQLQNLYFALTGEELEINF